MATGHQVGDVRTRVWREAAEDLLKRMTSQGKGCKKFRGRCSTKLNWSKPWWPTPLVLELGRSRQGDCCKLKGSLSYRVRSYFRKQKSNKNVIGVRK